MMRYYGMDGYGFGLAWIPEIIIWVVVIVAIIALVKFITHRGHGYYGRGMRRMYDEDGDSAMDILKERYVKGEITKKEFEEMKKDISD